MISIWGFPVQSKNLPWVIMALHLFTGGSVFEDLIGLAVGHLYYFLTSVLPDSHGYEVLKTPSLVHRIVQKLNEWQGDPPAPPGTAPNGFPMPGRNRVQELNNDGAQANPAALNRN
jgi:hypothetical protein